MALQLSWYLTLWVEYQLLVVMYIKLYFQGNHECMGFAIVLVYIVKAYKAA